MTMSKRLFKLLAPCLLALFAALTVNAQTATATLSGMVEDQNGASVPDVTITVENVGTRQKRTVVSNDNGYFTVPLLPPGEYTINFSREGFAQTNVNNVVLNVADQKSLEVQLRVGDVKNDVEVQADASLLDTSGAVTTTIDRTFVQNMPLNGRSFSTLALLTPGVTVTGAGFGSFSVNGQRPGTNYFTVDGAGGNIGLVGQTVLSPKDLGGALPGESAMGGTSNLVSIDALEEFKVQTSTYGADSGRQPGAQVQVVTRSGKNQFSGTLFEYFRNEALDARNYFNFKPAPQAPLRQNIFGGTFSGPLPFLNFGDGGGPLIKSGKDRTFFFFSYEGHRLEIPNSGVTNVPSLRLRQQASPVVRPILDAYPTPSGPEFVSNTACPSSSDPQCNTTVNRMWSGAAPYNYSTSNPSNQDSASIRIDHHLNGQHRIFGRFSNSPSDWYRGIFQKTRVASETRTLTLGFDSAITSHLSNAFRFNHSRQQTATEFPLFSEGGNSVFNEDLLTFGNGGSATIGFTSLTFSTPSLVVGESVNTYQKQLNLVDDVTIVLGAHQLKVGVDYRRLNPVFGPRDSNSLRFTNEAGIRNATFGSATIVALEPTRPTFQNFSAYIQDTWRVSRKLTLDLGLRWEFNPSPTEANEQYPRVVQGIDGTDIANATLAPVGTPFYRTFYKAFAPRFGAAYKLRGKSNWETVVRGGFGVYYDLGNGSVGIGWPFQASRALTGACLSIPVTSSCATRPTISVATTTSVSLDPDLTLPYTLQWNITTEQSLGKGQSVTIGYVASASRELLTSQSLNQQPRDPNSGALLPRPNPNFGPISYVFNRPISDYNSMQVRYKAKFANVLQALVNYTWSHAIDEVSTDFTPRVFDQGDADFDIRHNLSAALHYEIPNPLKESALRFLLSDWSLDALVYAQTGQPLDIVAANTLVVDDVLVTIRPDVVPGQPIYIQDSSVAGGRRINPLAFQVPQQCLPLGAPNCANTVVRQGSLGRNSLRQLPIYQLDLALARSFRFGEKRALKLKAEAFNVFNHPMFATYQNQLSFPATLGVPSATLNSRLGGLNQIYNFGGPRSIQLSAKLEF